MQNTDAPPAAPPHAESEFRVGYANTPADIPDGTLVELFFQAIDEFDKPDAMLHRSASAWRPISHRHVLEQVQLIAQALAAEGVRRGDRVALLSENRPEWALTDWAIICHGALTVPVYPTLPPPQIAYMMEHAEVDTAFVSSEAQLQKMLEVRAQCGRPRRIVAFDDVPLTEPGVMSYTALLDRGRQAGGTENEFRQRAREIGPQDLATLVYTLGTTGTPKAVMLTHANLHANVIASLSDLPVGLADVALSFLPLSHVFQRTVDYVMFSYGCTIAYVANFDEVTQAFQEVKPTVAVAVPRVYEKVYARVLSETGFKRRIVFWARRVALQWAKQLLAGHRPPLGLRLQYALADRLVFHRIREGMGGRIRFFISGSAPLAPQITEFFYGAGLLILEGYGLTEASPVTNVNTPQHMRIGTVGRPIPGTEERVADDGEILIRGPQIMKGYYKDDDATRTVIDAERWLHTGDIGEIDADGFLRITDRKKELIKTAGGKYIAPQPIRERREAESLHCGSRAAGRSAAVRDRAGRAQLHDVARVGQTERRDRYLRTGPGGGRARDRAPRGGSGAPHGNVRALRTAQEGARHRSRAHAGAGRDHAHAQGASSRRRATLGGCDRGAVRGSVAAPS